MTDLPAGLILMVLGTVAPDGYVKVPCPWEHAQIIWKPRYIDNMPSLGGPLGESIPNPDYYEFICVRPKP